MPIFLMLGLGLTVITGWVIFAHVLFHGTRTHMLALFVAAWLVVFVLWWWQL